MYGHTIGGNVAMGYVGNEDGVSDAWVNAGRYEIEVATVRYEVEASLKAFYDPANKRIKC